MADKLKGFTSVLLRAEYVFSILDRHSGFLQEGHAHSVQGEAAGETFLVV